MTKLKCWKKQIVKPNRTLWTKGKFKPGEGYKDWVHVDDIRDITKANNKNFEVRAKQKINTKTVLGHFKFYKNKPSALKFANKYVKENNQC